MTKSFFPNMEETRITHACGNANGVDHIVFAHHLEKFMLCEPIISQPQYTITL